MFQVKMVQFHPGGGGGGGGLKLHHVQTSDFVLLSSTCWITICLTAEKKKTLCLFCWKFSVFDGLRTSCTAPESECYQVG